jgi:hypothetical protein
MATATLKGRATTGTGDPEDLTGTQATALLDTFTSGAKGLAPASGGGTTNFLRADGTWAAPSGGGGGSGDVVGPASATDNAIARFDGTTGKLIQNSAKAILDDDGNLTLGDGSGAAAQVLTVNGPAGFFRSVRLQTNSASRATLALNNAAESGSDAGSKPLLRVFKDNGTTSFDAFTISRDSENFEFGGTGGITVPAVSTPAAPASGKLTLFGRNLAGRILPAVIGPSGLDTALQPILARNKVAMMVANGNATTVTNLGFAATTNGTATARNVATTNLFTSMRRIAYVSAATANNSALWRGSGLQWWRGNAAGLGGFLLVVRFGNSDASFVSNSRTFVGMHGLASNIGNVDPSTLANIIGVGNDSADTTLQIMHNDGAGNATKINLGANFPANTVNVDMYELALFCAPNGSTVGYRVERLNTGDVAEGTLSTDLPASTQLLTPHVFRHNGGTAAAVGIDIVSIYIETDY